MATKNCASLWLIDLRKIRGKLSDDICSKMSEEEYFGTKYLYRLFRNKINQSKTSTIFFFYYGRHFSAHIVHLNFIKPEATHLQLAVSMRVTIWNLINNRFIELSISLIWVLLKKLFLVGKKAFFVEFIHWLPCLI